MIRYVPYIPRIVEILVLCFNGTPMETHLATFSVETLTTLGTESVEQLLYHN
jgi:hypothetical protein